MCSIGVPALSSDCDGVSPSHPRASQMWGTNRRAVRRGGGRCSCSPPPSHHHRPAQTFLPSISWTVPRPSFQNSFVRSFQVMNRLKIKLNTVSLFPWYTLCQECRNPTSFACPDSVIWSSSGIIQDLPSGSPSCRWGRDGRRWPPSVPCPGAQSCLQAGPRLRAELLRQAVMLSKKTAFALGPRDSSSRLPCCRCCRWAAGACAQQQLERAHKTLSRAPCWG